MVHNLQRLIYLCHVKNELNRKRRRFYYYMNHYNQTEWSAAKQKVVPIKAKPKHISFKDAEHGYRKAQREMKEMTKMMGKMRIEMGCRFIWNNSGLISHIETASGQRLKQESFNKYYEAEIFEMELFNG